MIFVCRMGPFSNVHSYDRASVMTEMFPQDLQQFVQQQLASGHYASENEFLRQTVRFYRDSSMRLEQLREDINDQLRRLDRGEGTKLADDAAMNAFLAEIEAEVQKEFAGGDQPRE
jgi:putative addiction module CopG family antidote